MPLMKLLIWIDADEYWPPGWQKAWQNSTPDAESYSWQMYKRHDHSFVNQTTPAQKNRNKTASRYGCWRTERLGAKEALSLQLNRLSFAAKGFRICFWCGDVFAQLAHFGFSF